MFTISITVLVLGYKSFCNIVCIYVHNKIVVLVIILKLLVLEMKFSLFITGNFDEALSDVRSAREFQPLHLEAIEWGM